MTKRRIIQTIAKELQCSQLERKRIVQKTLDVVELRDFGVFELKKRKARLARNPRTGERVPVPERWTVTFKPGLAMQQKVSKLALTLPDVPLPNR